MKSIKLRSKKTNQYKNGDRVKHQTWGNGTFKEYHDYSAAFVLFDKEPENWYNPLCISIACLTKISKD
jgi:hypothetical protein